MSNLYVRLHSSFWTHRKTLQLRRKLGDAAFWIPPRLWSFAAENAPDGDLSNYQAEDLAMLVQYSGNAQEMLQALNDAGFLENGIIRNWEDRNAFHVTNHDRAKKAAEARWAKRNEKLSEKKDRDKEKEKEKESKQALTKQCLADAPSIEVIEKPTRLLWEIKFGLELPESLRTEECREAVNLWLAYKSERRQAYKPIGLKAALNEWGREYTADQFPSIVQNSIAKNWQGIHPPRTNGHQQSQGDNRYSTATAENAEF
jgi:hypothetical protein